MVRQDFVYGLKNAIERGASLEQAKQSFISAGYSLEEIEEAAQFVYSSSPNIGSSVIEQREEIKIPSPAIQRAVQPGLSNLSEMHSEQKESFFTKMKRNMKLIILLGVLLILIIILVLTLVFKEQIIGVFS
ncbi:MAG: hypothetical protein AABX65_03580 [Nanoarchaeota archaeon]